tara:strand:+ start:5471 stop:5668 length:198 start_codon:yes stop_codon:yes gene_type:complete
MNLDKTIKNWKWWAILPIVVPLMGIVSIPRLLIFLLELIIAAISVIDVIDRPNSFGKKLLEWVHN